MEVISVYQSYKLPFEGFLLDYSKLNYYESLSYNETIFNSTTI